MPLFCSRPLRQVIRRAWAGDATLSTAGSVAGKFAYEFAIARAGRAVTAAGHDPAMRGLPKGRRLDPSEKRVLFALAANRGRWPLPEADSGPPGERESAGRET